MTARCSFSVLAALSLALGLLAASAQAQPAGTLLVGLDAEPVNLDPAQVTDLNSNRVGRRVVEGQTFISQRGQADNNSHGHVLSFAVHRKVSVAEE